MALRRLVSPTLVLLALLVPASASAADPVVAAAGDIACDPTGSYFNGGLGDATHCRMKYTSDMLVTGGLAAVLAVGDTQYEEGTLSQFQNSYEQSWGRVKSITRPVIGNHEYFAPSDIGQGYFDYFNGVGQQTGVAGDRDKGYYSFDIGAWHLIALNSVCQEVGGCAAGSPQEQWLRADLETHPSSCTLAYWHHPLFTAGAEGSYTGTRDLWQALYEAGADLVLTGHAHAYERFVPQDVDGNANSTYGITEIVAGTGGKSLGSFTTNPPNEVIRDNQHYGILRLTLHASSYDWSFQREGGGVGDSGTASCHGAPPGGPPTATTGAATSIATTSARINGAVNPHGRPTTYRFEYGPTTSYDATTPSQSAGAVNSASRQVGADLTGLAPATTYHYRVVADSAAGTVSGDDRTFTTGAAAGRYAATILGTPGLLGYWRLGEAAGSPFEWDQHGLQLGTYVSGPVLGQPGALAGDSDTSASFDGVDDQLSLTGPSVSTAGTLEGWFKWTGGPAIMRDDSWADGWILGYDNTSGNLGYRAGGTAFSTGRSVSIARDGRWHHFALTKNGTDAAYYLDGALLHDPAGAAANDPASGPWHVMKSGQRTMFAQGQADEVAVYDVALSAQTIKEHYDAGKPDVSPPDTFINTGPSGAGNSTSASFTFSSTESGSTFRCRLDGPGGAVGSEAACGSPKAYTGLADGAYSFRVYAVDSSGNVDASAATRSFTVDTTAPETAINSGPSGTQTSTDASFTFSSTESNSSFQCRMDAAPSDPWAACTSPKNYTGLGVGTHTFEVRATDAAGNTDQTPASRSFTVESPGTPADTTAPDTSVTGPSGLRNDPNVSFSFSSTEAGSTFRCRLDGPGSTIGTEATCSSPRSYTVSDGAYTFRVYAVDAAGNADPSPATRSFTVDTVAPDTTIDSGPSGTTNSTSASFTFSSSESGSSFQCHLDLGAWSPCSSPQGYSSLAAGSHVFEVRATDAALNTDASPASRSFTVAPPPAPDTSPPDTTITSGPSGTTSARDASFAFVSSESGSSFQCRLDGGGWGGCSSPASYSGLGNGQHTFNVRAIDAAGNVDASPASRTWTVKRSAPKSAGTNSLPTEPTPTGADTARTKNTYRPRSYKIELGGVYRRRGAMRRLYADDRSRLEIAAERKRGSYLSNVVVTTSIGGAADKALSKLTLTYDGGTSGARASVTGRIYNFRTRRWEKAFRQARRADRTARWSVSSRIFDYISPTGQIKLELRGTAARTFRARSDLVRIAVVY